jgi:hypothetical protein
LASCRQKNDAATGFEAQYLHEHCSDVRTSDLDFQRSPVIRIFDGDSDHANQYSMLDLVTVHIRSVVGYTRRRRPRALI